LKTLTLAPVFRMTDAEAEATGRNLRCIPSAIMATTVATGMRNPRIQATPPICSGLTVGTFGEALASAYNGPA
jgi:hypothetical protein